MDVDENNGQAEEDASEPAAPALGEATLHEAVLGDFEDMLTGEDDEAPERRRFSVWKAAVGLLVICALLAYFIVPIRTTIRTQYLRLTAPLHPIPLAPKHDEPPKSLV
jgi:hypothetical protein